MNFPRATLTLIGVLILSWLTTGCAGVSQKLDAKKYYKRDIIMKINGEKFVGVAVPDMAPSYKIELETPGNITNIAFTSCHRDEVFRPDKGMFSKKNKFEYTYTPNDAEKGRGCVLEIGSYEARKFSNNGRHSWGLIAFDTELENLPAILECNGERISGQKSTSVCQGKTGTLQTIQFDHRVKFSKKNQEPRCNVLKTKDDMFFSYIMPEGNCLIFLRDQYHNTHALHLSGYKTLLIRGEDYENKKGE